jgi:diaminopimelate decarboxylase
VEQKVRSIFLKNNIRKTLSKNQRLKNNLSVPKNPVNPFTSQRGVLHAENVSLVDIANTYQTPCYVYSKASLESAFQNFCAGLVGVDHLVCFAVKANPSLAILNLFAKLGAGFDIVSGGELARVLAAGGDAKKIVFSGVGKTAAEMQAALEAGIFCFNVESAAELERLNQTAQKMGKIAPVSLRVNPNVDAKTHPYISTGLKNNKFGVAYEEAFNLYQRAAQMQHVEIHGVDCHIGSQLTELSPFLDAFDRVLVLVDQLEATGIKIQHIDIGGGIGICYNDETPPDFAEYTKAMLKKLGDRRVKLVFEPGRALVGNAGLLLTKVEYLKHTEAKNFAIVDAAMNDLMRPALYDAYHEIVAVQASSGNKTNYEVVGPVCESGDFLGHDRELALKEGDLLAILSAGAYGMSMSSNYNTRPRAAEVMVDADHHHLIRQRETVPQLFALEAVLPSEQF